MIGVADAAACGIPFKELSTFRDYVRNHADADLTAMPAEIKFGIIHRMADEYRAEREERTKTRQTEMDQLREVAEQDAADELERDRKRQPSRSLDEYINDAVTASEDTAPSPLPDSSTPRRRRRRSARP